ncbi:MAG: transaldolase [Canibacter sp.]
MTKSTQDLSNVGVSIWLDDLSRSRLSSGNLKQLITDRNVVGVTTNPTIFAGAISGGDGYEEAISASKKANLSPTETIFELTTTDVADACDLFADVFAQSNGQDGRVSIEVEPGLANDAAGTVTQARELWQKVNKPNAMIKIPATEAGLEAIADTIAEGISVNVTLIFSLERHRQVINAYLTGLERAREAGIDISTIHSVASFFVSRVDTEIDKRLEAIGTDEALALKGKSGLANARLAYEVFEQGFSSERAKLLLDAGAQLQRPLWASTGVKDPNLPDTLYVTELAVNNVVNTMPEKTLEALADHGEVHGDTVTHAYEDANATLDAISQQGISYEEVTAQLETEGVDKFIASWNELVATVETQLKDAS